MKSSLSICLSTLLSVLCVNAYAEDSALYYKISAGGGKEIEVNDYISSYCSGMISFHLLLSKKISQEEYEAFHNRMFHVISNKYGADTNVDYDDHTRAFNDGARDLESCASGETTVLTPQMQTKLTCRQTVTVCDTEVSKLLGNNSEDN